MPGLGRRDPWWDVNGRSRRRRWRRVAEVVVVLTSLVGLAVAYGAVPVRAAQERASSQTEDFAGVLSAVFLGLWLVGLVTAFLRARSRLTPR
jgi:hypothetical protein